ncbi:hypothetical protein EV421DRAFT_966827 [Armillaria borealis]|uniref:Uncharacterized protein n=1 Tax=Armillaria borealis TaxID=47425 RepID=A0AA39J985_9AGAR|nr:hypothetical protein EV421DRAFT_966827 [Armillaria borealis]
MSSPLNSMDSPPDIDINGGEQMILDDTFPPEIGDNSPKSTIVLGAQEIDSATGDIAASDNESPSHNDVGSRAQSLQRDSALPSPLSDASGHPSPSNNEGIDMPWERRVSILLVMGPKPEKGPHNSWHTHENRLGVEWEDMRCSPQLSADLLNDENCRGFIYPLRLAPGEAPVLATGQKWGQWYAHYMTLLLTRFPETPFISVTRCSIESFIDKVCSPSELEKLDQYTCIIARLTDPSSDDLASLPPLASPPRLATFVSGMRELCKRTAVFPDIDEMEYAAQKLRVIECLDSIAQSVTSTPRPKTSVAGGKFPGQIYKREGSHCERHVLLPKQIQSSNYRSVMREGQHPTYRWLQQDYVPYNIEWRVFLVGGEVVKVRVSKRKELDNSWVAETQYSRCPLFELEERLRAQPEDEDEFPDLTAHDEESRIRSDEELIGFAERTLAALVQRETEILGHVPSISMLCRLDISVMRQSRSGQLQYWVVSVARGANVPIHGIDDSFDTLGVIADELVDALRKKPGASDPSFPYYPGREIAPPVVRDIPVDRTVKYILVVPGPPNSFSPVAKVWGNTHTIVNSNSLWVKVDLPRTDVQLLVTHKATKGFIHEIPLRDLKDGVKPRRGYSGVWIHQLVLLGYYWSRRNFTDVTFMSWSDFIDRAIAGNIKADIIWGGVDLTTAL